MYGIEVFMHKFNIQIELQLILDTEDRVFKTCPMYRTINFTSICVY